MYSGQLWRKSATFVSGPTPYAASAPARRAARSSTSRYVTRRPPCTTAGASGTASATRSQTVAKLSYTRRLYVLPDLALFVRDYDARATPNRILGGSGGAHAEEAFSGDGLRRAPQREDR